MNNSFLYHAFGLYAMKCTREEYKGKTLILNVRHRERKKRMTLTKNCYAIGTYQSIAGRIADEKTKRRTAKKSHRFHSSEGIIKV